jgi:hypothetical protein
MNSRKQPVPCPMSGCQAPATTAMTVRLSWAQQRVVPACETHARVYRLAMEAADPALVSV